MNELMGEINLKRQQMHEALRQIKIRGRERAQTEKDYRVALRAEYLKERDNGTPVTIISDICRGSPSIAALKFERDVADSLYFSACEAVNVYKRELTILENQINREWNS